MSSERSGSIISGTSSVLDRIQFKERISSDSSRNSSVVDTSQSPPEHHWTATITPIQVNAGKIVLSLPKT